MIYLLVGYDDSVFRPVCLTAYLILACSYRGPVQVTFETRESEIRVKATFLGAVYE